MSDRLVHRTGFTTAAAALQLADGLLTATVVAPLAQTAVWMVMSWVSPGGFWPMLSLGMAVLVVGGLVQSAFALLALGEPIRFRRWVHVVGFLQLALLPFGKLHAPLVLLVPSALAFVGRPRVAPEVPIADRSAADLVDDELTRTAAA